MSPLTIESIAVAQLAEHREFAERLRLRRQARVESRREDWNAAPTTSATRSILSRLRLRAGAV
jgi:hypothetical protein